MKVFLAGASGAVGEHLIPQLVANGHQVVAMARSPEKQARIRGLRAEPAGGGGPDRAAVLVAVRSARPEAVIHQMTSLASAKSFRRFDREFAVTNRLRTEGLDHLLAAAQEVGATRFVAQSYGNWNYERT